VSIYPIRMCQFDSVECVPSIGYLQFRNVHFSCPYLFSVVIVDYLWETSELCIYSVGGKNRREPVTRKGYFEGSGL